MKLGGNKGHSSFKLNMQLVNIFNPNFMKRTTLLLVFKAGDRTLNLHTALNMNREHVEEAQGMQIKNDSNIASYLLKGALAYRNNLYRNGRYFFVTTFYTLLLL